MRKSSEKSALNPPPKEKSSRATDSPTPNTSSPKLEWEKTSALTSSVGSTSMS